MSSFLFSRQPASAKTHNGATAPRDAELPDALRGIVEIQSITASAIFAMLVSKGVLSADEAADYMREIGAALASDVRSPAGALAGKMLRAYGDALAAAEA
jgi:hypothetical protein